MNILVATESDACCGPMAAAFLRNYSVTNKVVSAGRNPLESIDSNVVVLMKECLIDMYGYMPRDIKSVNIEDFDCIYECPDLPMPKTLEQGRELRDYVKNESYLFFRGL